MNVPMLQAKIDGYQEYLFDQQCLAVHYGYWAGYYQSKKPKLPNTIIEKMARDHTKAIKRKKSKDGYIPKPEVDVDLFMKREARRKAYLKNHPRK